MAYNVINQYQTFRDSTGEVRAAGIVTFYDNLTTDLASIWSNEALTVAQSNPYTLDAYGRITGDVKYKGLLTLKIQNADLSDTRTDDNVASLEPTMASIDLPYTTSVAADSRTPNTYTTAYYDNGEIVGSGTVWTFTGTTTAGKAGNGLDTDLYVYNANGDQYAAPGELNVKWFNVLGDGATDDTTQIQAVITYAETINGTIYFPSGTYVVSSTLNIQEVIKMYGDTDYSSILEYSGGTGTACINYNHSTANVKQGQSIEYLWIDGIAQLSGRVGVYCGGNQTIINMSHCRFQELDIGIEMHGSVANARSYGNQIVDCQFWLIETNAIWSYGNAEQFLIKHCWITFGSLANADNDAILVQSATSGQIEGCVIQGHYNGIVLNGCKPVTIKSCHFEDCTKYNILLEGGVSFQNECIKVEGCYISDAEYGIAFAKDSGGSGRLNYGTVLMANTFTSQTVAAMHGIDGVSSATGLVIINCSWHNDFTPGAIPLIDALTPILTLSHDETIPMAAPNLEITNQLTVAGSLFKTNTGTDLSLQVDGVERQRWKVPTSGETAMYIQYHNGSAVTLQRVLLGVADSGGAGYKLLRVIN